MTPFEIIKSTVIETEKDRRSWLETMKAFRMVHQRDEEQFCHARSTQARRTLAMMQSLGVPVQEIIEKAEKAGRLR
jgi:hypothetical protein